jgi:outer membrane protein OmpA-like peptidoglycan-associated protein
MRIVLVACFALALSFAAHAQDVEGGHDHPALTRYPGSSIQWHTVEDHRAYKFPLGPATGYRLIGEWIKAEGRLTRIYYTLENSERNHTEVWRGYRKALVEGGFDILAAGVHEKSSRGPEVGTRNWQEIFFAANPWKGRGPVANMTGSSTTSGGSGTIIAKKVRAGGDLYVAVSVYQFSDKLIATLVDVLETATADAGPKVTDAAAMARSIKEYGRAVLDGLLFEPDTATLREESGAALGQIAAYLKAHPDREFYIVGHTDSAGTLEEALTRSEQRAKAVVKTLTASYGVDGRRLEGYGVGPLSPIFTNASETGREQNRRMELVER